MENWPATEDFNPGKLNVENAPFVNTDTMFVSPLCVRLELMNCFRKGLETMVKISSSCIVRFKISVIMRYIFYVHFGGKLILTKLATRNSFRLLFCGFQANRKRENYPQNHRKSLAVLQEFRMPDAMGNPFFSLTLHFPS